MTRINLKNSTPKPVSFFVPPRARGAYGFRFEGVDFLKAWVGMVHRVFRSRERAGCARGLGARQGHHRSKAPRQFGTSAERNGKPLAAVLIKAQDSG